MRRAPSLPPELAGFDYVRHIGAGGFADVFLYEQKLPRRNVAVKVLLLEELTAATRASFVAEANLMAQLSTHPYIVTIYHADVATDGRPYFVMEYCSGPSLSDRYKREPFSVVDALRTGVRISSAVATAHSAGILHRDIKPANVLTNAYGWPALTDFGISSAVEDELPIHTVTGFITSQQATEGTTGSQSVGMSIPWSPPEMFDDDPQPDVRADVFSLAATIHTLLAGRSPFEIVGRSNGTLDLIGRIERGAVTPITRDDVPRTLIAVLQKGMASRKEDRYPSAIEFARALQRVELELGYAPTTIEVPNVEALHEERPVGGGDDETRVRSVATILAQPLAPAPAPQQVTPPPVTEAETALRSIPLVHATSPVVGDLDEATVMRPWQPAQPAGAAPAPASAPPAEPAAPELPYLPPPPAPKTPASRRGVLIAVFTGLGLLIVAALVVAGVLLGGDLQRESTPGGSDDDEPSGGSAVVQDTVPVPENGTATASADGTSVTFSWENPDEEDGDSYRYARSETPSEIMPANGTEVTIDGLAPGARSCIDAYIVRGGTLSVEPLTICHPDDSGGEG